MLSNYNKTIAALLAAASTWVTAALADGQVSTNEWYALALAVAGVFGVYRVKNTDR
jgi:hypothetical protein